MLKMTHERCQQRGASSEYPRRMRLMRDQDYRINRNSSLLIKTNLLFFRCFDGISPKNWSALHNLLSDRQLLALAWDQEQWCCQPHQLKVAQQRCSLSRCRGSLQCLVDTFTVEETWPDRKTFDSSIQSYRFHTGYNRQSVASTALSHWYSHMEALTSSTGFDIAALDEHVEASFPME